MIDKATLAKMIDHTKVSPNTTEKDIKKLCNEAKKYGFNAVCVPSIYVKKAKEFLRKTDVKVICVIGFPFGFAPTEAKVIETKKAIEDGADEIDMVMNRCWFKSKRYDLVEKDIREVVKAAKGKKVKVIIETSDLSKKEIVKACLIAKMAGAHFIKTSTGYTKSGAKVEDIKLIKKTVPDLEIKASGGIRSFRKAVEMVKAGATRIGTSTGVAIIEGKKVKRGIKY